MSTTYVPLIGNTLHIKAADVAGGQECSGVYVWVSRKKGRCVAVTVNGTDQTHRLTDDDGLLFLLGAPVEPEDQFVFVFERLTPGMIVCEVSGCIPAAKAKHRELLDMLRAKWQAHRTRFPGRFPGLSALVDAAFDAAVVTEVELDRLKAATDELMPWMIFCGQRGV